MWSAEDEVSLFPALTLSPDQISVGVTLLDAEDFCVKTCSTEIAIKFASDQLFENFKRVLLHRNLSHVWHKFRQRDCACLELDSGKPVTIHLWEGVRLVWLHPLLKRNLSFEAPPISGRASVPCGSLAMESTSGTTRNSTSCAGRRSSRKTSTRYSHQVFTPGIYTRYSHQSVIRRSALRHYARSSAHFPSLLIIMILAYRGQQSQGPYRATTSQEYL